MAFELVYTSVPQGIKPGTSGFCIAAFTQGLPPNIASRLEGLSAYKPVFPHYDSRAGSNPVSWSHYIYNCNGEKFHLMSRVAFYGLDYTNRSNKLAHHLVLRQKETSGAPGGPGEVILNDSIFRSEWKAESQIFPQPIPINVLGKPFHKASAWERYAGDAGWAGKLAQQTLDNPQKASYIVFDPERHHDLRQLVEEALQLIPLEKRWEISFNTYFTGLPAGFQCQWRFCSVGSDCLKEAKRVPGTLLIDLTSNLAFAGSGPLIEAARTGNPPAQPKPVNQTAPADKHAPVQPPKGQPTIQNANVSRADFPQKAPGNQFQQSPFYPGSGYSQSGYDFYTEPPKKKFPIFIIPVAVVLIVVICAVLFLTLSGPKIEPMDDDPKTKTEMTSAESKQEKGSKPGKEKTALQTASEQKKDAPVKESAQTKESKAQENPKDPQVEKEQKEIAKVKKAKPKTDFFKTSHNFDWSKPTLSQLVTALEFKKKYSEIKEYVKNAGKYKDKDHDLDSSVKELNDLLKKYEAQFTKTGQYPKDEFSALSKDRKTLDPAKYNEFKKKWRPDESTLKKLQNTDIPNIKLIYERIMKDKAAADKKEQVAREKRIRRNRRELWYHKFNFVRIDKDRKTAEKEQFKEILFPGEKLKGVKLFSKERKYSEKERPIADKIEVKADNAAQGGEITVTTYRFNSLTGDFEITRGKEDTEGVNADEYVFLGSLITEEIIPDAHALPPSSAKTSKKPSPSFPAKKDSIKRREIYLQFKEGYSRFPVKKLKKTEKGPEKSALDETWDIGGKYLYEILEYRKEKGNQKDNSYSSKDSHSFLEKAKYNDFHWEYVDPKDGKIIAQWNANDAKNKEKGKIEYLYKDISKYEKKSKELEKDKKMRDALDELIDLYNKDKDEKAKNDFKEKLENFKKTYRMIDPPLSKKYDKGKIIKLNDRKGKILRSSDDLQKEIDKVNEKWKKPKSDELPGKMQSAVIRLVRKNDNWILCEILPPKKEVKK